MEQHTQSFRFFNRGPSPAARLVFFLLLSLLLMFIDARYNYLESVRSTLSVLVYPFQRIAAAPAELWQLADDYFTLHDNLVRDNTELRQQHTVDQERLLRLQALQAENEHLRNLLGVQQHADYPMQLAEIAYTERDIFKRKLFLDKGAQANILPGQVVMDDTGVVGQVTRVYPWLSEVTLITDKDHAVPVQILRNGLHAVVFGSGDTSDLALRYMPVNADLREGDLLVTSGIDGTYPPGLPVASISHIERDPTFPFARVVCTPVAGVDRQRQLLILQGLPKLPERPEITADPSAGKSRKSGRRKP
jgi:rod shape-determining protein MreC